MATLARPLWPGTVGPSVGTPARVPGSVRRTSSVDMLWPDGAGTLVLRGCGRDLATLADGSDEVRASATLDVAIDTKDPASVVSSSAFADVLVGAPVRAFRGVLDERLPDVVTSGGLLALLLDEVPAASLISRAGLVRMGLRPSSAKANPTRFAGVCAGWVAGGAMMRAIESGDEPYRAEGPSAPSLDDAHDELGWHELGPLPPGSMRRRRRLDVISNSRSRPIAIDAMFRDSFMDEQGTESVVHEYGIAATVRREDGTIVQLDAVPRVLPGPDCPAAASSAGRLVGMSLHELRGHVRRAFTGTSTCTHLNDALRSMGDLATLLADLPAR